ncbi:hypothetical protein CO046_05610 [Candidatus Peregrinibacteria bacterium CG_4_9_14_0_2_um_filter_53_11]|nr:MAG: hypothetical protein CO046_05610 [Candidatus Peregrinibacteria bacterium CG_4_9_14_0_2_um_filter_53_11]
MWLRRLILGVIAISFGSLFFLVSDLPDGDLHFYALNVGQGDALFLQTPSGHRFLFDGGPGKTVVSELGAVMPFFSKRIDAIFVTHPDRDHLEGILHVLKNYEVGALYVSSFKSNAGLSGAIIRQARAAMVPVIFADERDDLELDDGVTIDLIYPFRPVITAPAAANNASLVAQVRFAGRSILITGDIEVPTEEELVRAYNEALTSTILKVPHHGSKTSSIPAFLEAVHAELAVISVGVDNSYHHPNAEVLSRLEGSGATVLRTDRAGRVEVTVSAQGAVSSTSLMR